MVADDFRWFQVVLGGFEWFWVLFCFDSESHYPLASLNTNS